MTPGFATGGGLATSHWGSLAGLPDQKR